MAWMSEWVSEWVRITWLSAIKCFCLQWRHVATTIPKLYATFDIMLALRPWHNLHVYIMRNLSLLLGDPVVGVITFGFGICCGEESSAVLIQWTAFLGLLWPLVATNAEHAHTSNTRQSSNIVSAIWPKRALSHSQSGALSETFLILQPKNRP
jgi:hypothetical protein